MYILLYKTSDSMVRQVPHTYNFILIHTPYIFDMHISVIVPISQSPNKSDTHRK